MLSTWQVWEDLLTVAARLAYGQTAVRSQNGFTLGQRTFPSGKHSNINVFPDLVVDPGGGAPRFVLDAKYKGHIEKDPLTTKESDLYEALAFSEATGCSKVALAYPSPPEAAKGPGICTKFEAATVGGIKVVSIFVEIRGISKPGAMKLFAGNLRRGVAAAMA